MNETIDYYDKNAEVFANGTADIEFSEMQDQFLSGLKNGASILRSREIIPRLWYKSLTAFTAIR